MPQHQQSIALFSDNTTVLAIINKAMKSLNWEVNFAGPNALVGSTEKKWNTKKQQIVCAIKNGEVVLLSKMVAGEKVDIGGKNKKNITRLIEAIEQTQHSIGAEEIESSKRDLVVLEQLTVQAAEQQQKDAEEINKAMNLAGSNLYATYAIIAINVLVFILMVIDGAGFFGENGSVHILWGSNFSTLTLSGDWWRLLSCTFIHFGIIHIAMNMYCLYSAAIYLEPMLGKTRYVAAYLCTGVLASLVSLWWHSEPVNSAGASGAVFGIYGVFLALLTTKLIPEQVRTQLLKSIGIFVVYNLVFGMRGGVDNSAHVGGLVSGFIIGMGYAQAMKKEREQEQQLKWPIPVTILLTIGIIYGYLQQNKVAPAERSAFLNELAAMSYKDNTKFYNTLTRFDEINNATYDILSDTILTNEMLVKKIEEQGLPKWDTAEQLIRSTSSYNISPAEHTKAKKLLQYIALKKEEMNIMKRMAQEGSSEALMPQLNANREKAYKLFREIAGK